MPVRSCKERNITAELTRRREFTNASAGES
jgi:hypothetical protein